LLAASCATSSTVLQVGAGDVEVDGAAAADAAAEDRGLADEAERPGLAEDRRAQDRMSSPARCISAAVPPTKVVPRRATKKNWSSFGGCPRRLLRPGFRGPQGRTSALDVGRRSAVIVSRL
jgi:hypothetical protein